VKIDMGSVSAEEDFEKDLTDVVTQKDIRPEHVAIDIGLQRKNSSKKKIIPLEVVDDLDSVSKIGSDDENAINTFATTTVVTLEDEPIDTIVDIENITGDTYIDIENNTPKPPKPVEEIYNKTKSSLVESTPTRKKKIIPIALDLSNEPESVSDEIIPFSVPSLSTVPSQSQQDTSPEMVISTNSLSSNDSANMYDDIRSNRDIKVGKPLEPQIHKNTSNKQVIIPVNSEIISIHKDIPPVTKSRSASKLSVSSSQSDLDPSQTPISRPESPIWDDCDYLEEEAPQVVDTNLPPGSKPELKAGPSPLTREGTLAGAIARLGRTMTTLDTEIEEDAPVEVPTVLIDEFDLDPVEVES